MNNTLLPYYYFFKYTILALDFLLLCGIIYYIRKLKVIQNFAKSLKEKFGINPLVPSGARRKWRDIELLLKEPLSSSWKLAVVQASTFVLQTLRNLGYSGDNIEEILAHLETQKYRNLNLIREIYQVKERILQDREFSITHSEAQRMVFILKKFWQELISEFI